MKTIGEITTPEAAQFVALFGEALNNFVQMHKIKNVRHTINGNNAVVEVTYTNGNTDRYNLIKTGGKWKIQTPDIRF